jgi:hypothetical protein
MHDLLSLNLRYRNVRLKLKNQNNCESHLGEIGLLKEKSAKSEDQK